MTTILHVIQQLSLGGGTRTLAAISKESARIGTFRHRVISLSPSAPEAIELARTAALEVLDSPDMATALREMARADLVQVEWWNSPEMQVLLHTELPAMRLLIWYHVCGDGAPQIITPQLANLADLNVATNPWTARELPVFRDLPPEDRTRRVAWVIPGASFERLKHVKARPHTGFNIGYMGTVDFVKMHRRYVPMSASVRVPEARFVVCGGGGATETLQAEAQSLGVMGRFDFRGFVHDIKPVIEEFDVYGYPLCEDTYASGELNLQEIMYAGVPPVVFPHGGVRGLIEHDKTGLVVRTEVEYRDALEHLYHHPEERKRLGEAARAHARQHFGAQNAAREMNCLYTRLREQPKRTRVWGCPQDEPAWEGPVTALDLVDVPQRATGSRLFLEGLGGNDGHFLASLSAQGSDATFAAETAIANCSTLVRSPFSGGILNYRSAFPEDGWLRFWSGLVLRQEGRLPAALGEFAAALARGCNYWRVGWYLAETAAGLGDTKLATQAVSAVLHAEPDFGPAKALLAALTPRPTADTHETAALVETARAAVACGNIEEFESALARALELEPTCKEALLLLAELNLKSGRFSDAAQTCVRLLKITPDCVPAQLLLAASFAESGETAAARDTYLHVLELEPGEPTAIKELNLLTAPAAPTVSLTEPPAPPAMPLVSAIVSTYNSARFMRGCLEDLERQTIADRLQIIVVDSGSTESEAQVVREFQQRYGNIDYLRTDRETVYAAWNHAVKLARGKYLTNANTDDRHRRDALERMMHALDANPGVALVYADCLATAVENETFETTTSTRTWKWLDFDPQALLEKGCFVGPQPMWRRELHAEHGYFDETMVSSGDYEFWLRVARTRDFLHLKETLGLYLESPTSVQHAHEDQALRESRRAQDMHRASVMARVKASACDATSQTTKAAIPLLRTPSGTPALGLPPCASIGSLADGRDLLRQNRLPGAWDATCGALKRRPFHPEAYVLLAEIARAAQDPGAARSCAEFARQLAPDFRAAKKLLKGKLHGHAKHDWLVLPDDIGKPKSERRRLLSVCLIVKNEQDFIGQCLDSVKDVADQIVLVDTGSTDRTVAIAREHGAQVHTFEWCDDFGAARNAALEHATGDWVLMLDADEELPPENHSALRKLLRTDSVMAWRLPIMDAGREGEGCCYVPRLFRNAPGLFYVGRIHEQVFGSLETQRRAWGLDNRLGDAGLRHHGYRTDVVRDRKKIERNLGLLGQAVAESPDDPNLLMSHGLELSRSGRLDAGLEQYRGAFEILARQPVELVVPELREMLLTQMSTHLMAQARFHEIVRVLTSPLAEAGGLTASLHFSLGLAYFELQQFSEAASHMRQCLAKRDQPALTPVNLEIRRAGPRHCLALCLDRLGQTNAAAEEFRLAIEADPQARSVRSDYARFLATYEREAEALNLFYELAKDQPGEARVWLEGGRVALTRPEFLDVALDWTTEAARHLPDDPAIGEQQAEALMLAGRWDAALPLYRRWPSASNYGLAAALVMCETATGENEFSPATGTEPAISREFVKRYQKLLQFGARPMVETVNGRIEKLERVLPTAALLLAGALAEATETASS